MSFHESGNSNENETFLLNNNLMENSNEQKVLGFIIDKKLNFKNHIIEFN